MQGVLVVSPPPNVEVIATSRDAAGLLGVTSVDLVGQRLDALLGPENRARVAALAATAVATGHAEATLHRGADLNGGDDLRVVFTALSDRNAASTARWLTVAVTLDAPPQETDKGAAGSGTDPAYERLREEFQQFAYAASHDLQEPVRMITSYLQLLQRRYEDRLGEDADEFIHYATDGAARLRRMIDGLLDFSRVATKGAPLRPVHSVAALARARNHLTEPIKKADATITHGPLPLVQADENQLVMLFQQLIANAIEFRRDEAPPRIRIEAQREEAMWRFSITDNGIGIDPAHHDSIFGAFEHLNPREDHPGIGMGLTIARRIVTRHGGRIWLESEPGQGSTFHFTLTAADEGEGV